MSPQLEKTSIYLIIIIFWGSNRLNWGKHYRQEAYKNQKWAAFYRYQKGTDFLLLITASPDLTTHPNPTSEVATPALKVPKHFFASRFAPVHPNSPITIKFRAVLLPPSPGFDQRSGTKELWPNRYSSCPGGWDQKAPALQSWHCSCPARVTKGRKPDYPTMISYWGALSCPRPPCSYCNVPSEISHPSQTCSAKKLHFFLFLFRLINGESTPKWIKQYVYMRLYTCTWETSVHFSNYLILLQSALKGS